MTWERGWSTQSALGGWVIGLPGLFLCVLLSSPGGLWTVTENPVNQRLELSFWSGIPTGMTAWEYLESWIGPD